MLETAANILTKKQVLIVGKNEGERRRFINQLLGIVNYETFRFSKAMKSFDAYLYFIKKHKLYNPFYYKKSYNNNQILDFHWDWITENNSLIVIEEFHHMEEEWQIALLKEYINAIETHKKGEKHIHLLLSQPTEGTLIDKVSKQMYIRENERRTNMQIVQQNLTVIDISEK